MGPAQSRVGNSMAANGDAGQQAESKFAQGGPRPWMRRARGLRERDAADARTRGDADGAGAGHRWAA